MSRCRLSLSGHRINGCPITLWHGATATMLKLCPIARVEAYTSSDMCSPRTAPRGSGRCWEERNSVTVSDERVEPLNQRLFHHRVMPNDHSDAQTPAVRPYRRVRSLERASNGLPRGCLKPSKTVP